MAFFLSKWGDSDMIKRPTSYGGGMQTFAIMVLAEQGKIETDAAIFADTGMEHPETYDHIEKIVKPMCERMDIPFYTVRMEKEVDDVSNLKGDALLQYKDHLKLTEGYSRKKKRELRIQYNEKQGIQRTTVNSLRDEIITRKRVPSINPMSRWCTSDSKLVPIYKGFIRPMQAKGEIIKPCTTIIGLSYDELTRMYTPHLSEYVVEYPLIDMKLTRNDCIDIIKEAGYEVPPKSGCYICPFQGLDQWRKLYRDHRELYEDAIKLEEMDLNFPEYRLFPKGKHFPNGRELRKLAEYFTDDTQFNLDMEPADDRAGMHCEQAGYCGV